MAKMAARYGHFGIEQLRVAVESIGKRENASGSLVFSPVFNGSQRGSRSN